MPWYTEQDIKEVENFIMGRFRPGAIERLLNRIGPVTVDEAVVREAIRKPLEDVLDTYCHTDDVVAAVIRGLREGGFLPRLPTIREFGQQLSELHNLKYQLLAQTQGKEEAQRRNEQLRALVTDLEKRERELREALWDCWSDLTSAIIYLPPGGGSFSRERAEQTSKRWSHLAFRVQRRRQSNG